MKTAEYYRPKTLAEALDLLASPRIQAVPLVIRPKPVDPHHIQTGALVDLSQLGLDDIRMAPDGSVHIGGLATLQAMIDSPVMQNGALDLLSQASDLAAGPGIRNLASLWGAIQALSGPPEISLALLALDAEIVLQGAGEKQRTISFQQFCALGTTAIRKGEIVLEACLPPQAGGCGWALERVARTPRDEAIVAAIALIEARQNTAVRVRLALAGANPLPLRLPDVESHLTSASCDEPALHAAAQAVMEQATPVDDFRGSSDYRRAMAGLIVQRTLRKAWQRAADQEPKS